MSTESASESPLKSVAAILCRHDVEFIVIGGQAESLHGSARITYDVDLCYRRTGENLERLAAALREMRVTLRNAPKDLPFQIDAKSLALGDNFTFVTPFDDVDFLGYVEPIGTYEELMKNAEEYPVGSYRLRAISLDDLIRITRFAPAPSRDQAGTGGDGNEHCGPTRSARWHDGEQAQAVKEREIAGRMVLSGASLAESGTRPRRVPHPYLSYTRISLSSLRRMSGTMQSSAG